MSKYIDVDKLQKDGWKLHREKCGVLASTFETMELDCVPTSDVRKNVHGEWIFNHMSQLWECSNCHKEEIRTTDFCPICGADMRGDNNDRE